MARMDLYGPVHKGLRTLLYDTSRRLGRTDFADVTDRDRAVAAVRRTLGFLDEHGHHEDGHVLPLVRAGNAVTADGLDSDHVKLEAAHRAVEVLLARLERADAAESVTLGANLYARFNVLVADHLQHMEREERGGNGVLWAHTRDEELAAAHQRVVSAIGVHRLVEWAEFLLPALDPQEREQMAAGLAAIVPAPVLAALATGAGEVAA